MYFALQHEAVARAANFFWDKQLLALQLILFLCTLALAGVLILDEPTSGLDSYTAEHVCKTLHDLAMRRSRAILLTIHQPGPEITQLFDHVLILSNGFTIYNGPADQLVRYFNSLGYYLPEFTNPCDYYG